MSKQHTRLEPNRVSGLPDESIGWQPLLLVLTAWAAIAGLSCYSYRAPDPKPESVAAIKFSAGRAETYLRTLVGDAIPHPAGSAQNEVVRNRIVDLLHSFGYEVEIQSGTGSVATAVRAERSPDRERVELHNIIAILKSDSSVPSAKKNKLMLVSHYDSVPMGPGACDDGVATAAVIEIARMLASEPPPNRDVVFLITDGEEFGLLGAKLFVSEHPLAAEIGVAINLEARGTTGPSCMFETSRLSRPLIEIYARNPQRKFASSLFYEIYRHLRNDTDFSVFNEAGMLGYNFAFIGEVRNYHTTADNLENANRGSLQHHGDNALGLIRELLSNDQMDQLLAKDPTTRDEAVYFDLFGKTIAWWPSAWSIWLSAFSAILLSLAGLRLKSFDSDRTISDRPDSRVIDVAKHVAILVLTVVVVFASGFFLQFAIRLDSRLANPWPENPTPVLIGYWLASFAVVGAITTVLSSRLNPISMWVAFGLIWIMLAIASSLLVNGASHLFIVPILLASICATIAAWTMGRSSKSVIIVAAAVAVGIMWLPLERLFYDAVGFKMPIVMFARIAIVSTALLVLLSVVNLRIRFQFALLTSVASIASFLFAILRS